ncbi:MAG TPA: hypothetical protein VK504_27535 [Vicinamibacterales bacterium]|nr:hypothetical protein [Vicinamibacterales bacterium]
MNHRLIAAQVLTVALLNFGPAFASPAPVADPLPPDARFAISRLLGREQAAYRASSGPDGSAQFANPGQHLSARFDHDGLILRVGAKATLRWTLAGLGYGKTLQVPERVAPRAVENRVEYRRRGMTEWYVNGPFGVQQGFTLQTPPEDRGSGPLTLALRITEGGDSVAMRLDQDGRGIRVTAAGGMLKYRGPARLGCERVRTAGRDGAPWRPGDRPCGRCRCALSAGHRSLHRAGSAHGLGRRRW